MAISDFETFRNPKRQVRTPNRPGSDTAISDSNPGFAILCTTQLGTLVPNVCNKKISICSERSYLVGYSS